MTVGLAAYLHEHEDPRTNHHRMLYCHFHFRACSLATTGIYNMHGEHFM